MRIKAIRLAQIAAGATVLAVSFALPASAKVEYYHHKYWHRTAYHHYRDVDRPLTVTRRVPRETVVAPDPYSGPAAIVTAPAAAGATVVSLPFRAANAIFPAHGDPATNPFVLVGAPIYVAGQVARLPFYVVGSAFGAPASIDY